jgi:Fic family protein
MANPSLLIHPLQKREALRSSSLEGTYATAKELLLFELDPKAPAAKEDHRVSDWREVFNYDRALRHATRMLTAEDSGLPLSLRLICEMHRILLGDTRGAKTPGEFRRRQVHVGSDRRYIPPPPERLAECLQAFERYLHEHGERYDALVLSYLVHYQFEAIHPFLDGNGRIGRALLSLTTLKWSNLYMPWLYMSAYFERYKDEYIDNMFRVSTHGDWDKWIEFCLRGTAEQCRDALRRCEKLNGLRQSFHNQLRGLPRMYAFVESVFQRPAFTTKDVASWCSSSRPTAKADIKLLMEKGIVAHLEGKRPAAYYVPAIYAAAYSEEPEDPQETEPVSLGKEGSASE